MLLIQRLSGGAFSGTFIAPMTIGTWYYRAVFDEQSSGSNDWTTSTSAVQSIAVVYPSNGAITRVQGHARQISTSSSFIVTLSQVPTSGNVLIAVIGICGISQSSAATVIVLLNQE